MNHRLSVLVAPLAAMLLLGTDDARAGTYRWVDEEGRVHYSDSVPADKVRLGYKVFDAEGRQVSAVEPAKTEEERAALLRQAAATAEQDRRDRVLLATFTSEEDLEYARGERLATIDAALTLQHEKLADLKQQYADLQAQASSHESKQEPLPGDLANRLEELRVRISRIEVDVAVKQEQKQAIEESFATDLARYRELKGLPAK